MGSYHRICISCTACMSWHQAMFPFFVRFMNHWNVTRTIIHCAEGYLTSICTYRQASPVSFVWVEQKVVVVDFISHGVSFFSKAICTWKYSPKTNMTMEKHRKKQQFKDAFPIELVIFQPAILVFGEDLNLKHQEPSLVDLRTTWRKVPWFSEPNNNKKPWCFGAMGIGQSKKVKQLWGILYETHWQSKYAPMFPSCISGF